MRKEELTNFVYLLECLVLLSIRDDIGVGLSKLCDGDERSMLGRLGGEYNVDLVPQDGFSLVVKSPHGSELELILNSSLIGFKRKTKIKMW